MLEAKGPFWDDLFEEVVKPRLEIIITLLLDAAAVVIALVCRGLTLRAYHYGVYEPTVPWHVRALEYVLDYGIVGTATAMTAFDLAKRVKNGWLALVHDKPQQP